MNTIMKIAIIFLAITGATTLLMNSTEVEFRNAIFWQNHGVFFLIFITLFPRLTLLFSNVAFGGLFWWLGFFFAPRILVATLATLSYWENNPVLVVIAWLVAISGETGEKSLLNTQVRVVRTGGRPFTRESFSHSHVEQGETIEAEYREIK
ncbi:MAG: hypothetical protein CME70_12575 [Halobacteriovorax sp.]|nr:hypothetical protein [Halobacteriovorax sp.]|tara:strand:+ start:217630 stop:218082 length:453 start_codon:yes stop_codon:yes gene_type:complete